MSVSWSRYDDDELAAVAGLTDLHLETHPEQAKAIEDAADVVRALAVLIPATHDNLFSGNLVPIFEAERELQTSTTLARLGFYKQALSGLRSVLELGLLSVYWDANDLSHIDIQEWLAGRELTPQTYNIEKRLQEIPAVRVYLVEEPDLFTDLKDLLFSLSGYVHTRGVANSTWRLAPMSNRPSFDASAYELWAAQRTRVVAQVLTFHLLKYPIGLQRTPLSQKFGLNSPIGGFVEPFIRERLVAYIPDASAAKLQRLSDGDSLVQELVAWVHAQPDLEEAEWKEQLRAQDRMEIQSGGYEQWKRNRDFVKIPNLSDTEQAARAAYAEALREWSEDEGILNLEQLMETRARTHSSDS